MFPIEIEAIGAGFVRGVGKLITKRSGEWAVVSILLLTLKQNSLCLFHLETATRVFVGRLPFSSLIYQDMLWSTRACSNAYRCSNFAGIEECGGINLSVGIAGVS